MKVDPLGNERFKARYVAQGYSQQPGSDYTETFAPTPKMSSVRMLMQIAAQFDFMVHHMDVKTAYLNAPIDAEIYLSQPQGYVEYDKDLKLVCKLRKSLYGLKQSGRNWHLLLHNFLLEKGFQQSKHDNCLYLYADSPNISIILVWVDDILMTANLTAAMKKIKQFLIKRFRMTDLGPVSCFLGIRFTQAEGKITMDQTDYLKEKLIKFQMDKCKPRTTPCELAGYTENDAPFDNITLYREMVGSLIYATTCTRPDLSWTVSKLSQHLSNPSLTHFTMLKHVFRYVAGTIDYCLTFKKSEQNLELIAYSDADWASSPDRRSTTGYYFSLSLVGPALSWKTKKQPTVALSSCESEYMALCAAAKEAIFLRNVLDDIGKVVGMSRECRPVTIFEDNQGALALAKNPVHHERSKHIDIKYHFTRECVLNKQIEITYVQSENNVADILTKAATKLKLSKFRVALFG